MIKAGDLVAVVRSHCPGSDDWLGQIFTVESVKRADSICSACHAPLGNIDFATCAGKTGGYQTSILKRIPPLENLDEQMRELYEDATA